MALASSEHPRVEQFSHTQLGSTTRYHLLLVRRNSRGGIFHPFPQVHHSSNHVIADHPIDPKPPLNPIRICLCNLPRHGKLIALSNAGPTEDTVSEYGGLVVSRLALASNKARIMVRIEGISPITDALTLVVVGLVYVPHELILS